MSIDIHAHCFPARYLERLEQRGDPAGRGLAALGAGDGQAEIDARLEAMDRAGLDMQVLSVSGTGTAPEDATSAVTTARLANDGLAGVVARRADRFHAFAALPLPYLDHASAELDRVLGLPGFVGACVSSAVMGRSIVDPEFEPLFVELERRAAILFIHPAGRGAESPLVIERGLEWPIGAPIEDTIVVTHLLARGIPSRFPGLRIVNAHLGGGLPMLMARLDAMLGRAVPDLPEPPSVAARRMWFDSVCHASGPALLAARAAFGGERLLLGTDYPFVRGAGFDAAVRFVGTAGLPAAEAAAILDGNARSLLADGLRSAGSTPAPRR